MNSQNNASPRCINNSRHQALGWPTFPPADSRTHGRSEVAPTACTDTEESRRQVLVNILWCVAEDGGCVVMPQRSFPIIARTATTTASTTTTTTKATTLSWSVRLKVNGWGLSTVCICNVFLANDLFDVLRILIVCEGNCRNIYIALPPNGICDWSAGWSANRADNDCCFYILLQESNHLVEWLMGIWLKYMHWRGVYNIAEAMELLSIRKVTWESLDWNCQMSENV